MTKINEVGHVATTISSNWRGGTVCTYHSTQIAEWDDHTIRLNTGGYDTVTTVRRMNQVSTVYNLGYTVFRKRGKLMISWRGVDYPYIGQRVTLDRVSGKIDQE